MIVDKFSNLGFYKSIIKNIDNGIAAVQKLGKAEIGKYEFDGGFFMVQQGTTEPMNEGIFETHKKYIDVHIILEGSEDVAWAYISDLKEETAYDDEKDAAFYKGDTDHIMHVTPGMCYVAYPHDAHMPVRHIDQAQSYTKIVMKLPAE